MKYYYIFTGNAHNQILIFESKKDAISWCKSATNWSDETIEKSIKQPINLKDNIYAVFE